MNNKFKSASNKISRKVDSLRVCKTLRDFTQCILSMKCKLTDDEGAIAFLHYDVCYGPRENSFFISVFKDKLDVIAMDTAIEEVTDTMEEAIYIANDIQTGQFKRESLKHGITMHLLKEEDKYDVLKGEY